MLIHIKGARVIDPANERDAIGDLWIRDEKIVGRHKEPWLMRRSTRRG